MSGNRASILLSRLREHRERAGLSQAELARRVHVSRQAIAGVESGRHVPSTVLALALAQQLRCSVDDLFRLPSSGALTVEWVDASRSHAPGLVPGGRALVARVDGRWVAHALAPDGRTPADALILGEIAADGAACVEPIVSVDDLESRVLVAGCAPVLGILGQRVGSRFHDATMRWVPANSTRALDLLEAGHVHVAGLHLADPETGEDNAAIVRRRFPTRRMLVINLTRWRQGLVLPPGNPSGIHELTDLWRRDLRFARREPGAGASKLIERQFGPGKRRPETLDTGPLARGHGDVAQIVRFGAADVGIAIEAVAVAAGLDFVPLVEERFDLVLPADRAESLPVSRVLEALSDSAYRADVARLPGYDDQVTGHATTVRGGPT